MTLNELKDGVVVEMRNGDKGIYLGDRIVKTSGWHDISYFNQDLTHSVTHDYDIVKVYDNLKSLDSELSNCTFIWEREEEPTPLFNVGDIIATPDGEYGLVIGFEESEEASDYNGYTILEPCDGEYSNASADTFWYTEYELVSMNFKKLTTRTQLYHSFNNLVDAIHYEYDSNGEA